VSGIRILAKPVSDELSDWLSGIIRVALTFPSLSGAGIRLGA
jgi:hypothetical protein